jgi:hypothetical protein
MLELLCRANKLSDAQQRKYLQQFYTYTLVVRPQVRAGEPIPYSIRETCSAPGAEMDLPDKWRPIAQEEWDLLLFQLEGHDTAPIRPYRKGMRTRTTSFESRGVHGPYNSGSYLNDLDLRPGRYQVKIELQEHIFDYSARNPDMDNDVDDFGPPLYSRTLNLSAPFEVIPTDTPDTVSLIHDPSLAEQIRAALYVNEFTFRTQRRQWSLPPARLLIRTGPGTPGRCQLPCDVAFDVFVRVADKEAHLGSATLRSQSNIGVYMEGDVPLDEAEFADVILRSSPDVARSTVDIHRIWDGELIFKDVPVKHEGQ